MTALLRSYASLWAKWPSARYAPRQVDLPLRCLCISCRTLPQPRSKVLTQIFFTDYRVGPHCLERQTPGWNRGMPIAIHTATAGRMRILLCALCAPLGDLCVGKCG